MNFQVIEQLGAACYESLELLMNGTHSNVDGNSIIRIEKSIREYGNAVAARNASFGHATSTTGSKVSELIGSKLCLKLELRRHIDGMKRHMGEQKVFDIATGFDEDVSILVELAAVINVSIDAYLNGESKRSMNTHSDWHGQSWLPSENLRRCSDRTRRYTGQARPAMSDVEGNCHRYSEGGMSP